MKKKILNNVTWCFLLFMGFTFKAYCQNCFKDCQYISGIKQDSITHADTIKTINQKRIARIIEVNKDIIKGLKGCTFPSIKLYPVTGGTTEISSYLGKPTLIFFWYAECSSCVSEIPEINSFSNKYKDKANFLSFTTDRESKTKEFLTSTPLNAINCTITEDEAKSELCLICGFPMIIILDQKGQVWDAWPGALPLKDFKSRVNSDFTSLLKKKK